MPQPTQSSAPVSEPKPPEPSRVKAAAATKPAVEVNPAAAVKPVEEALPDVQPIQRLRDELRLKLHLAGSELKDEWERTEVRWGRFEGEIERLRAQTRRPSKAIRVGLGALAHELAESYRRIEAALRRPV